MLKTCGFEFTWPLKLLHIIWNIITVQRETVKYFKLTHFTCSPWGWVKIGNIFYQCTMASFDCLPVFYRTWWKLLRWYKLPCAVEGLVFLFVFCCSLLVFPSPPISLWASCCFKAMKLLLCHVSCFQSITFILLFLIQSFKRLYSDSSWHPRYWNCISEMKF